MRTGDLARFAVIGLGTLVGPLDTSVNIAFPDITDSFAIPLQSIQWVVICYVMTYASLMLIFGRLGDLFGHQRIFRIGLAVSALSFLLCASAERYDWLLVFRIGQGIGTAMVISCGPALVTSLVDETLRPRALGAYTAIFGIGAAVGPSLGGLIVAEWGWASVFWYRFPIALSALLLSFLLPVPPVQRADGGFDRTGAALLVVSLGLLLATLNLARSDVIGGGMLAILIVVTLAAAVAFVRYESSVPAPIISLGLFRNLEFALFNLTNIAVNFAGFSVMLLVPYFLINAAALPVALGGLVLASGALGMIGAAQFGGMLVPRLGAGRVALIGALLVVGGVGLIGFWPASASVIVMVASLLVHGSGLGLFQVSCLDAVTAIVPRVDRGVAGSLVMVSRTVGIVLAASLLTLLFVAMQQQAAGEAGADTFLIGFQLTFRYTAGFLLGYLLLAGLVSRLRVSGSYSRHR